MVRPGAVEPTGWSGAERVAVTDDDVRGPSNALARLRSLALDRQRAIIEITDSASAALDQPESTDAPPHALGPRFDLLRSTLRHLVTANSIDLTGAHPRWPVLDQALASGATVAPDGVGDIVSASGERLWLDGGPIRFTEPIDGVAVVHRVAVERGSLEPFRTNSTTAELAADQTAAVTHQTGTARIIAPAGSGKTRVLTERARHLLRHWALPPSAVSLVAFNKRAQEEMRERTADLRGLQVRTLNAIALAIVNGTPPFAPTRRSFQTIDEGDVRRIIGRLVSFPRKRNSDPVATWIEALSLARLGLKDPQIVERLYDGDVDGFPDVLARYRRELERAGQVDFDEQVQRAIEILLTDPDARRAAQRSCRVLLVDEFQDLTPAHLLLVRLLAGPDGAVFGVGDDDQTIYGYNGADPAWLIEFDALFPGAGEHPLEVNYRCPADVVAAADMLLRHNGRRVAKTIRAATDRTGLTIEAADDTVSTTVDLISEFVGSGGSPAQVAVLTRVNSLLAPVQVALRAAGVPTSGGVGREFLDRVAVRAALAWLRLAVADGDFRTDDVAEALRRPSRSIHPNVASWAAEQQSVDGLSRLAGRVNNERDAQRIAEFAADIERLRSIAATRGTTSAILDALRTGVGLASSIATLDTLRRGMNRAAQNDDLTAIAQLAALQPDPRRFEPWLRDAVSAPWSPDGVTLATVHRVKGQEWPFVVVHQADADQFPHRLAEDVEEERRVFHVAITRASRTLHVVAGATPSPFIDELTNPPTPRRQADPRSVTADRPSRSVPAPTPAGRPGQQLAGADAALFAALKDLRRHLAAGKPAYTVLSDASLEQIVLLRPRSLEELAAVRGVGPAKLEAYGDRLVGVVLEHDTAD
ncbi:MAG: hypothetical protein RI958_3085 [Actinomycetota bacterium]